MIKSNSYNNEVIFAIAEGAAEKAVLELLIDNEKVFFNKDNLFESRVLTGIYRKAKLLIDIIKSKRFEGKVLIIYLLDSKREAINFEKKIKRELKQLVDVNTVLTRPEIEILFIISKGDYENFKNRKNISASNYCKTEYKQLNIKKEEFVKSYYSDIKMLLEVIKKYNQYTKNNDLKIYDLLKEEYK